LKPGWRVALLNRTAGFSALKKSGSIEAGLRKPLQPGDCKFSALKKSGSIEAIAHASQPSADWEDFPL